MPPETISGMHGEPAARSPCDPEPLPAAMVLTPLTGRDTEVSLLRDRWEQAQEAMGQVVLVIGEAGLGKSRLVRTVREQVREAGEEACVIEWRCADRFQHTGLFPITDYFQRVLDFHRHEPLAERFNRLAQYLDACGMGRPQTVSLFARLLFLPVDERYAVNELSPMREREETFRAIREWLGACARQRPVLFIIEDLHWMDASTLEFLAQFVAEGLHDRMLAVLTFRPEFRTPWPAVAHQTSLALNRLTRRQVAQLLRKTAPKPVPDLLVEQIFERTAGVPLLVEEFSRMTHGHAEQRPIPATLQELIEARLERLTRHPEVAQAAAILGREFQFDVLRAVVGVEPSVLEGELEKLETAEILFAQGEAPPAGYRFKHALLEEAIRGAMEKSQRQELHRAVAETLETEFPELARTQPEVLAHHFAEARSVAKAARYWLAAGKLAHARFANLEAISHLERGLTLLHEVEESPARDVREVELLGPLGTAYIAARGYAAPEVGPIFERALELSKSLGITPDAFTMRRGHFAYHIVRGNFRHCAELAGEAVRFAEEAGDDGMMMEALFLETITHFYRGDFARAAEGFTRAIRDYDDRERTAYWAARTGENTGVTHRCYLALAEWHLGRPERALAMNAEARELARAIGHPFSLEYALHHTGWLHQLMRNGAEAEAAGREEMQIAAEQGFVFWHASGTLYAAAGMLLRGNCEAGLRELEKGLAAYRATGARLGLPYYFGILGEALTAAGRHEEAWHALNEALSLAEAMDERCHEAELHRMCGELYLAEARDEAAAATCFDRAIATARRQQSAALELRATLSRAQLWHRQGSRAQALASLPALLERRPTALETPDHAEAAAFLRELGHEHVRDELAAGTEYVRACIPPPMKGAVAIDWRYVPSFTLGGDAIGYHRLDEDHLALYLIDVTGHGLDAALHAVTICNVIRSGSIAGADLRRPDQVLAALNEAFPAARHSGKFFTLWYGVYHTSNRELIYASGGHPPGVLLRPDLAEPSLLSATGTLLGISPHSEFPAVQTNVTASGRLYIFSDGVCESRTEDPDSGVPACVREIARLAKEGENVMDGLLARARQISGSSRLADDFSMIEARFE